VTDTTEFWTGDSQAEPVVGSVARFGSPTGSRLELRVDELDPGRRVVWTLPKDVLKGPRWTGDDRDLGPEKEGRTDMTGHSDRAGNEQEALWYLGGLRIITALGERFAGTLRLADSVSPAGTHIYALRQEEEGQYVLAGEATVVCGGQVFPVRAGTFLFLPGNVPYQMQVSTSGPFRSLTWLTPAGFAHDVTQMGNPDQALLLAPPRAPDRAKMQRLADLLRAGPC
jgi:Cupin domain